MLARELLAQPSFEPERHQGVVLGDEREGLETRGPCPCRDGVEVDARGDVGLAGSREHVGDDAMVAVPVDLPGRSRIPVIDQQRVAVRAQGLREAIDERESTDRHHAVPSRLRSVEQGQQVLAGLRLDHGEAIAIEADPDLPVLAHDAEREVVEELVRDHHVGLGGQLAPDGDPGDLCELSPGRRPDLDGRVGRGDVREGVEQLTRQGAVPGPDLGEPERVGSAECLPEFADGAPEQLPEHWMDVGARDEITVGPDRRSCVEPARSVQGVLHELGDRDRAVVEDRVPDRLGRSFGHTPEYGEADARCDPSCLLAPGSRLDAGLGGWVS